MRLNLFLSQHTPYSRRKADELIQQGRVMVNKAIASLGQKINPDTDTVTLNKQPVLVKTGQLHYFAINKPMGVVSTTQDELDRPTVLSLLPKIDGRIYPIGRLDIDSQGLMLLTNDGRLTHQLTHPSNSVSKVYKVLVDGRPTVRTLKRLETGVPLKDGNTAPAEVEVLDHQGANTWLSITLHQGRNRQIRRMLAHCNHQVIRLIRVQVGSIKLEDLKGKSWVKLTSKQVEGLKSQKNS